MSFAKRILQYKALRYAALIASVLLGGLALLWAAYFVYNFAHPTAETTSTAADMGTFPRDQLWENTKLLLEEDEILLPTYDQFLAQLQQTCPYYQPSGYAYRECLSNLLVQNETTADRSTVQLGQDLKTYVAEFKAESNGVVVWQDQEAFLSDLRALSGVWKAYRDSLCAAEIDIADGGSNQSGLLDTCKLYQTALYDGRLQSWRHEWIDEPIQVKYIATSTPIKTAAFRELVHRSGVLGD